MQTDVGAPDHFPATHCVHTEAADNAFVNEPAGHVEQRDAPAAEYVPSVVQSVHVEMVVAPTAELALPAAHAVHVAIELAPIAEL